MADELSISDRLEQSIIMALFTLSVDLGDEFPLLFGEEMDENEENLHEIVQQMEGMYFYSSQY